MASCEEFGKADARAVSRLKQGPVATGARYDRRTGRIVVRLDSGVEIGFAPGSAEGLEGAKPSELAKIEVTPSGLGLHFPKLDADLYLPALIEGLLGSRRWMAARLGEAGGRVRSSAKAAASRGNGRLGGRPRKSRGGGRCQCCDWRSQPCRCRSRSVRNLQCEDAGLDQTRRGDGQVLGSQGQRQWVQGRAERGSSSARCSTLPAWAALGTERVCSPQKVARMERSEIRG